MPMLEIDFPRFNDKNIDTIFQKLKDHMFIEYRGVLILHDQNAETKTDGYYWKDQWYQSVEEAQKAVDEAFEALSLQISITLTHDDGTETAIGREYASQLLVGGSPYESYKNFNQ